MKFFVLTLALAALAGTWASVLRDEPDSKLEKLTQQGMEDADTVIKTLLGKFMVIDLREEKGPGLMEFLQFVYRNMSRRLNTLEEELPEEVVETFNVFVGVPVEVGEKAIRALSELRRHGSGKLEEFGKALLSAVADYVDPALEKVSPYAATVRGAIVARAQEIDRKINENLPQQVETLRAQLDPHIKKLQELQASLKPYLDQTQELVRKGVESFHNNFVKPYMAPIVELRQKYKKEFREWVAAPVFSSNP